jgi:hypothetical protein
MDASRHDPELRFLWHPDTTDIFSGYGLLVAPAHVVGLLMVDRPDPVDANWLEMIERTFGSYQLTAMTTGGKRGMVCQMRIAEESMQYLRVVPHPDIGALRDALIPLLNDLPAVTLHLAWSANHACWMSRIIEPRVPLFPLGMVVGTQGAVDALETAGQSPQEFLDRHAYGDWGDVPEADKQENDFSLQHGFRILSSYTTKAGERIWVLTEADRSATTMLLPDEY